MLRPRARPSVPLGAAAPLTGPGLPLRLPVERRDRFLPGAPDWSPALSIKSRRKGGGEDWLSRGGGVWANLWAQGYRGRAEEVAFRRSVGAGRGGPAGSARSSGVLPGPQLQGQPRARAFPRFAPVGPVPLSRWREQQPESP